MNKQMESGIVMNETVEISFLKKMISSFEKTGQTKITFEALIGSCFPHIADNIKQELRHQHALGYAEGLKAKGEDDV